MSRGVLENSENTLQPAIQDDSFVAFIGPNADYYQKAFNRIDETGKKQCWNWAAFFGGNMWAWYRKINGYAWEKDYVRFIVNPYGYAMYGNWLYKQKVEEEIAAASGSDAALRKEQLQQRGGVSYLPIIVLIVSACAVIIASCNQYLSGT